VLINGITLVQVVLLNSSELIAIEAKSRYQPNPTGEGYSIFLILSHSRDYMFFVTGFQEFGILMWLLPPATSEIWRR